MSETKNILILAAALLLAVTIYCFGTRYQMVAISGGQYHGHAYLYDSIAGKSWILHGPYYRHVEEKRTAGDS